MGIRILQMQLILSDGALAYASESDTGQIIVATASREDLMSTTPTKLQELETRAAFLRAKVAVEST